MFPFLIFMLASGGNESMLFRLGGGVALIPIVLPALAVAVIRYATFSYQLGRDEMIVRHGLLTRNERHIPYARIQNIDLSQNPLHRWAKVAVVRLETASGGKPEAVIRVLELSAVDSMRRHVFADREGRRLRDGRADAGSLDAATGQAEDFAGRRLLSNSLSDLAVFGLISNKGMVVVAAVLGLVFQNGPFPSDRFERWLESVFGQISTLPGLAERTGLDAIRIWQIGILAVLGLAVFVVLTRLLSIAWAIVKFYGFTLDRRGDDLRTTYGLVTRVSATVPRRRIQLVSARLSLLHRLFQRVSLQVETAGSGGGDDDGKAAGSSARLWLAPVAQRADLPRLLREVVPEFHLEAARWRSLAPTTASRLLRRNAAIVTATTALVWTAAGPWALTLFLLLPCLAWWTSRWVARSGWTTTDDAILFRSGALGLTVSAVPFAKIQCVSLRQTPFDRRHRMARLSVDTAGANLRRHRVSIPYLPLDVAEDTALQLEAEAARRTFRW
ncbi:MAG: PH domain-containing protein [Acidobacteriota bacterium]